MLTAAILLSVRMKVTCLVAVVVSLPSIVNAIGFVHDENFIVYTPTGASREADQRYAELVLKRAEEYRSEIAEQWLGEKLPAGAGQSVINIDFSSSEDRGLTWAKDHPGRLLHKIYLKTSPDSAIGSTLKHEIAHSVFATKFPHPNRLPEWVEEGIASRYDDEARRAAREQLRRSWVRIGRAPRLVHLLESPDLSAFDESSYATATSLVSFLLKRGDEKTVVAFGADARTDPSLALQRHYKMTLSQLQREWEAHWHGRH